MQFSAPLFEKCLIAGNTALNRFGGGVRASSIDDDPRFVDCVMTGNHAERGGGISLKGRGEKSIVNTIVTGNLGFRGGGLYTDVDGGSLDFSNMLVCGNSGVLGSGCFVSALGSFNFTNCTVAENGPASGLRLADFGPDESLTFVNVVLRNLIVAGNGSYGVVETRDVMDVTELSNCLFFGQTNDFLDDDAVNVSGAEALNMVTDTLSSENVDGDPRFAHGSGRQWESKNVDGVFLTMTDNDPDPAPFTPGELRGSLIHVDTSQLFVVYVVDNTADSITFIAAPGIHDSIGATASYELRDYRLFSSSAAVDAGRDFSSETPETLADILGVSRPQGVSFDIGAYERVPSAGPGSMIGLH